MSVIDQAALHRLMRILEEGRPFTRGDVATIGKIGEDSAARFVRRGLQDGTIETITAPTGDRIGVYKWIGSKGQCNG